MGNDGARVSLNQELQIEAANWCLAFLDLRKRIPSQR